MTTAQSNPFALLMNPEIVLAAMAGSERLAGLTSRICRPLDRPLIARTQGAFIESDDDVAEIAGANDSGHSSDFNDISSNTSINPSVRND